MKATGKDYHTMGTVRIDPSLIPDYVYDLTCSVLAECVTRALSDPKLRQEYEAFKKEYLAEKEAAGKTGRRCEL